MLSPETEVFTTNSEPTSIFIIASIGNSISTAVEADNGVVGAKQSSPYPEP